MEESIAFSGNIPESYDRYLGPFFFEPPAADLIKRVTGKKYKHILELASGTGRLTKHL